jgi:hypothetical protein
MIKWHRHLIHTHGNRIPFTVRNITAKGKETPAKNNLPQVPIFLPQIPSELTWERVISLYNMIYQIHIEVTGKHHTCCICIAVRAME